VVPSISSTSDSVVTEGTNTSVTLSGSAFTNVDGGTELTSDVILTAPDGSTTTLTPDSISQGSITVTIPGNLGKGNYKLKTAKVDKYSNPIVISIIPDVIITDVSCKKKTDQLTIQGSGFGEKPEGTNEYLNAEYNGEVVNIESWTDTEIKGFISDCRNNVAIVVNTLFGSDTFQ
jgi:hypothetical protein